MPGRGNKVKTIITETNVYKFGELSDKAKQAALKKLYDINVNCDWWDCTYDDATTIGMEITSFDLDRRSYCEANIYDAQRTAELIIENHGDVCDTYKLAKSFLEEISPIQAKYDKCYDLCDKWGDNQHTYNIYGLKNDLVYAIDDLETEFKRDLCEEYRIMLQHEYEYMTSEKAIIESIEANEFDFTEDGTLF